MRIESQEDWWNALNDNWYHLVHLVDNWHPTTKAEYKQQIGFAITAEMAEKACNADRIEIAKKEEGLESPGVRFYKAREAKDPQALGQLLSATWFGIPESISAHSLPGFGVLCDLCSENWVFHEEEIEDE